MRLFFLVSLLLFTMHQAYGSDLAKERRWADQIVDALLDGQSVSLNDGKNDFLGILTRVDAAKATGVIILHGIGVHPDWPQVISPLRVGLAELGWMTLSLQMPVLPNEADPGEYDVLIPDAEPRIRAGVQLLESSGLEQVVVIGHSLGAEMAAHALAETSQQVQGFVAIGMPPDGISYLKKIAIPTLDLYGDNDLPGVVRSAAKRAKAASANPQYRQIKAIGADHFFNEQEEPLVEIVSDWLSRILEDNVPAQL